MVLYEVTRDLSVGPIDRWSSMGSHVVYLSERSTDGPVSYTSPPSLVRWTDGLCVADGPMGHTVHMYTSNCL